MAGVDTQRLVLIHTTIAVDGKDRHAFGTGYFVTGDLVLTARHVLSEGTPKAIEVRVEATGTWMHAQPEPAWENKDLDAALIRLDLQKEQPLDGIGPPWGERRSEDIVEWTSTAYPSASAVETEAGKQRKSTGLKGRLYGQGGGGQGRRELDLGVDDAASRSEGWKGISGAPVFVGDALAGIIKTVPEDFGGDRLNGVPIEQLLQDPAFLAAIGPPWLEPFPQGTWVLVLLSEHDDPNPERYALKASEEHHETIRNALGQHEMDVHPRVVAVTEALENRQRWIQFIRALCTAPVMIVDITRYQPAVMLFLGIRAVVRRGVTITITTDELDESHLSSLPFDIQEIKLISLAGDFDSIINRIGYAIKDGLIQMKDQPDYLDLPAYDAVRCPKHKTKDLSKPVEVQTALNSVLMLCSFRKNYKEYWKYVYSNVRLNVGSKKPVRMIDISSPRLVGQALYEHIRWSPCCVVDWTHWRANVLFELGVRLACSDSSPICLIEERALRPDAEPAPEAAAGDASPPDIPNETATPWLNQKNKLIDLLDPIVYTLDSKNVTPFKDAFERFNAISKNQEVSLKPSALPHNATYQTIIKAYDWRQERITEAPHEALRAGIEAQLSEDPEKKVSESSILFSSNPQFKKELERNIQERWIAAWFYFRDRYLPPEFAPALWKDLNDDRQKELMGNLNSELRDELSSLIENVNRVLSVSQEDKKTDPDHEKIYGEIKPLQDLIDVLEYGTEP